MFKRAVWVLIFLTGVAARADTFDVQIGAFRNPNVTDIELPDNVGELRSTSGPDGLTRFVVGPFPSRGDADRVRDQLRASGFPGAFVRAAQDGRAPTTVAERVTVVEASAGERPMSLQDIERIEKIEAEYDGDVVYLDGRLHRKVGDRFIPVNE